MRVVVPPKAAAMVRSGNASALGSTDQRACQGGCGQVDAAGDGPGSRWVHDKVRSRWEAARPMAVTLSPLMADVGEGSVGGGYDGAVADYGIKEHVESFGWGG